jgi:hypothetical protein
MRWVLHKQLVILVLLTFACYVIPVHAPKAESLPAGKPSANAAASLQQDTPKGSSVRLPLRFGLALDNAYTEPDTTEFEFPEEEKKHLVRDVTIFVIASVFVAYFVIKVFLEGDTEEEDTPGNGGKDVPGG